MKEKEQFSLIKTFKMNPLILKQHITIHRLKVIRLQSLIFNRRPF